MDIITLIWIGILVGAAIAIILLVKGWIRIYNSFIYWYTKAERKFADISVVMQQRIDQLTALAQTVKKYDIHEYKAIKDTIEARSRWTKDTDLNSKVKAAQEIENNFFKIQAVFERYPKLKAELLHKNLMKSIWKTESKLRHARLDYNRAVQGYNERLRRFPRKIIASAHGFKSLNYLEFPTQTAFEPKKIFED